MEPRDHGARAGTRAVPLRFKIARLDAEHAGDNGSSPREMSIVIFARKCYLRLLEKSLSANDPNLGNGQVRITPDSWLRYLKSRGAPPGWDCPFSFC
jgi:hypothetical protein